MVEAVSRSVNGCLHTSPKRTEFNLYSMQVLLPGEGLENSKVIKSLYMFAIWCFLYEFSYTEPESKKEQPFRRLRLL